MKTKSQFLARTPSPACRVENGPEAVPSPSLRATRSLRKLRAELAHLQARYDLARRLSRRNEMVRLSRRMNEITIAILKLECPKRRKAA